MVGRAVECGGLENRCGGNPTGGSNPSPSATKIKRQKRAFYFLSAMVGFKERYRAKKHFDKKRKPMSLTQKLNDIIKEYISDFLDKQNLPYVVKPSIPVIWFGDMTRYENSSKKIVTIGINPSLNEFEKPRFSIIDLKKDNAVDEIKKTLNSYFEYNPYKWFANFEKVLKQFDASYYKGKNRPNIALHIDIYSAIATDPTWGKLSKFQQNNIQRTDLFKKLFDLLNPDIIIFSVNREVFNAVFGQFEYLKSAKNIEKNGFFIEKYTDGNKILFNARNFRGQPFGGMTDNEIQEALRQLLNDNNTNDKI